MGPLSPRSLPLAPRHRSTILGTTLWLTLVVILPAATAFAQWSQQSPSPTQLDVRGVGAPTPERVFLATSDDPFDSGGALWESADGGATWTQRSVPFSLGDPLNGIYFLDSQRGWTFGNANYRTVDGGSSWVEMPFLGSTYSMVFHTPTFGIALGNFGRSVSRDGGVSWDASPDSLFAFDFADDQLGLGVTEGGLFRTTDGGTTFGLVYASQVDSTDAQAVAFLSTDVAVGIVDGNFVRSIDGGQTWNVGVSADDRTRLLAVSATVALAWGRRGTGPDFDDRILRSDDGGQTWTDLGEPVGTGALALAVPDSQTVVASDRNGNMFRSIDGGQTWSDTFTSPGPVPSFLSSATPVFADALTGYFGYGSGFVIKTTDGGATWNQVSSGSGQNLNDLDRFADGRLISVGDEGTVLTSDGTGPWTIESAPSASNLRAVQVVVGQEVMAVDANAQVLRSADGGETWAPLPSAPSDLDAEDLHFTTLSDGWVVGDGPIGGALYRTPDGGSSWTGVPGFGGSYVAVDFEGSNGWAASAGDRFQRSLDAGVTWTQDTLPGSPFVIEDMDFFDESIGYAVGWSGYAARSSDGGLSWQVLPTPNAIDRFTDIYLVGANELWLSTSNDVAYYSATGGQSWAVLPIDSQGFGDFTAIAANAAGDAWVAGGQGIIERFAGPPPPPLNRPPDASFEFVATGLTVEFTDTSVDPDGTIVSRSWDFGDSAGSNQQNPTHTYGAADTYIVTLTVTDDDGDSESATRFITVQPQPGGTFGDFTEVTPIDPLFVTPQDEDFWVTATAPADYDNDGDLDVAVFGYYVVYNQSVEDRLVLFRNDGELGPGEWEFAYVEIPVGTLSAGTSDLAWADVDGDGDQDLAVGSNDQTVLYRNDAGTMVLTNSVLPGYWEQNDQADFDLRSMTWADYDNDGDPDLLLPSVFDDVAFEFQTRLLRNDGPNGTGGWVFTEAGAGLVGTSHAQSEWADYDGDQDLDLLLVNLAPLTDEGFIRRYRNDGDGVFVGEDVLDSLAVEHGEVQWGDYDSDGDLDILVAGRIRELDGSFDLALRIYRNDAETYVPVEVIPCVSCEGWFDLTAATWADYDSDGDIDILLAGTYNSGSQIEGRARIYVNDGGSFSPSANELPAPNASGSRGGTFSWLDLDGDGDLDYFIAGQYFVPGGNGLVEAQMHAYRNDVTGQNDPPTAPSGLSSDVGKVAGSVVLSWSPASDDLTPTAALTYDLDLFRDGTPVQLPARLPQPGNVSAVTSWTLTGLIDGDYDWTLRAVDSAFNGGPAAKGSFAVGATAIVDPGAELPRAFALEPNYPNPFNPSTTLRFALPERSKVEVNVYDLKGRRVARLLDETQEAGLHEIRWNARGLASGTYLVRLRTATFTQTRRVVLLK